MHQDFTAGAVIARAFEIYRDQFGVLVGTALLVFAVEAVASLALPSGLAILAAVVSIILTTFYQGMVVALVHDVQDGRRDNSVGDLLRGVSPVVLPLLVVSLLAGLGIGVGFLLLIVPGLFLLTIWAVVAPVCVLERPGILASFGRSRELVRGHGWTVFAALVLGLPDRPRRGHRGGHRRHRARRRRRAAGDRRLAAQRARAARRGAHRRRPLLRAAPARDRGGRGDLRRLRTAGLRLRGGRGLPRPCRGLRARLCAGEPILTLR